MLFALGNTCGWFVCARANYSGRSSPTKPATLFFFFFLYISISIWFLFARWVFLCVCVVFNLQLSCSTCDACLLFSLGLANTTSNWNLLFSFQTSIDLMKRCLFLFICLHLLSFLFIISEIVRYLLYGTLARDERLARPLHHLRDEKRKSPIK